MGAYGDGIHDDTSIIQNAINNIKNILLPSNSIFKVLNIEITTNKCSIYGEDRNTSILNAHFIFIRDNSDFTLYNLTFDGKDNSQGFRFLRSNNVIIRNCSFVNITNKDLDMTKAIAFDDLNYGIVENCIFDNIYASDENGVEGTNNIGACRAIWTYGADKITIQNNIFKNIIGEEDTDIIHIQSGTKGDISSGFPYQGLRHGYPFEIVISNNTFYITKVKSSIKIQCDGVSIRNNQFYVNNITNRMLAVIRVQAGDNHTIDNNFIKVYTGTQNVPHIIYYHTCANSTISNNIFEIDGNSNVDAHDYSGLFICSGTQNVTFINNKINVGNWRAIFYLLGNENIVIKNNFIKCNADTYRPSLLRTGNSYNRVQNNLYFEYNYYEEKDATEGYGQFMEISTGENIYINHNNIYYNRTFEPIRIDTISGDFYFEYNLIDTITTSDNPYYILTFAKATSNIYSRYNTVKYKNRVTALIRAYDLLTNVHFSAAYDNNGAGLYYCQSGQDLNELNYYDTYYQGHNLDLGWGPAGIKYQNGHKFFYYNSHKIKTYYNGTWYNADGTTDA